MTALPTQSRTFKRSPRGPSVRRRYHFGVPGLVYVGITLLVALGAFNSQNNLLFWTFGFALCIYVVSGALSGAMLMGVRVVREGVGEAVAGQPAECTYRVTNSNRLIPAFALTIEEFGFEEASPSQSWATRLIRWARPVRRTPALTGARVFVHHVGPRDSVLASAHAMPTRRGWILLRGVRIRSGFPFGLIGKSMLFSQPARILVHPTPIPIDRLELAGQSGFGGQSISRRSGQGDDFFSLREYRDGDAQRSIAWRASARRVGLVVKEFAASSPARIVLSLWLDGAPARRNADEASISLAAGLAHAAAHQGIEFAIAIDPGITADVVNGGIICAMGGGPQHLQRALDELAMLEYRPRSTLVPGSAASDDAEFPRAAVLQLRDGSITHGEGPDVRVHARAPSSIGSGVTP